MGETRFDRLDKPFSVSSTCLQFARERCSPFLIQTSQLFAMQSSACP